MAGSRPLIDFDLPDATSSNPIAPPLGAAGMLAGAAGTPGSVVPLVTDDLFGDSPDQDFLGQFPIATPTTQRSTMQLPESDAGSMGLPAPLIPQSSYMGTGPAPALMSATTTAMSGPSPQTSEPLAANSTNTGLPAATAMSPPLSHADSLSAMPSRTPMLYSSYESTSATVASVTSPASSYAVAGDHRGSVGAEPTSSALGPFTSHYAHAPTDERSHDAISSSRRAVETSAHSTVSSAASASETFQGPPLAAPSTPKGQDHGAGIASSVPAQAPSPSGTSDFHSPHSTTIPEASHPSPALFSGLHNVSSHGESATTAAAESAHGSTSDFHGLHVSEADEYAGSLLTVESLMQHPAWPALMPFGQQNNYEVDPVMAIDPVTPLVDAFWRPHDPNRPQRSAPLLAQNAGMPSLDNLETLFSQRQFGRVAAMARYLLTEYTLHPAPLLNVVPDMIAFLYRLWFLRLFSFSQLERHEQAQNECTAMGYDSRTNSDLLVAKGAYAHVPFELRLYLAALPSLLGQGPYSIACLYTILTSGHIPYDDRLQLEGTLVSVFMLMKDYVSASARLQLLVELYPDAIDLWVALARVALQVGHVEAAEQCVRQAEHCPAATYRKDIILAHRAYLAIARGDNDAASQALLGILAQAKLDLKRKSIAIHNLGICQLYSGNVGQAISYLESMAIDTPDLAAMSHELLFNLATLYDLTDKSTQRKCRILAQVVAPWAGDNFDPECLKLPAMISALPTGASSQPNPSS